MLIENVTNSYTLDFKNYLNNFWSIPKPKSIQNKFNPFTCLKEIFLLFVRRYLSKLPRSNENEISWRDCFDRDRYEILVISNCILWYESDNSSFPIHQTWAQFRHGLKSPNFQPAATFHRPPLCRRK